jgi:hypothetical protein
VAATSEWVTTTLQVQQGYGLRALADGKRKQLVARLPPHYIIHAYADCFDRDERGPSFVPWTFVFHRAADPGAWLRDRAACVRLNTHAELVMMRRHVD